MPLLDSDIILAYLKEDDWLQDYAENIFVKIIAGELDVYMSTAAFVELAFVCKREKQIDLFSKIISTLYNLPHVSFIPLSEEILEKSTEFIQKGIGVLDSIQAATAINFDKTIISSDHIFDKIKDLKRIKPEEL